MDEYYCPNCGATLNDQSGFSPDKGHWTCTKCGMDLFDEDAADGILYEGVFWVCDNCGASLSSQPGFLDTCGYWTCLKCGFTNRISEDDILDDGNNDSRGYDYGHSYGNDEEEKVEGEHDDYGYSYGSDEEEEEDDDDYCGYSLEDDEEEEDYGYSLEDDEEDSESSIASEPSSPSRYYREATWQSRLGRRISRVIRNFARRHLKAVAIVVIAAILGLAGLVVYVDKQHYQQVPMSSDSAIGQQYKAVEAAFAAAGFEKVSCIALGDLSSKELAMEGTVAGVRIANDSTFEENSRYRDNTLVTITYHSIRYVSPPTSRNDAKGQDYKTIVKQFEDAGFENVRTEASCDVVIGVVNKVNSVKNVTIDGEKNYSVDDEFRVDCEVVISYHSSIFGD